MSRHDGSGGHWNQPSRKGKGHAGRGVMRQRRKDSGMSKQDFEALLRRLDIRGQR